MPRFRRTGTRHTALRSLLRRAAVVRSPGHRRAHSGVLGHRAGLEGDGRRRGTTAGSGPAAGSAPVAKSSAQQPRQSEPTPCLGGVASTNLSGRRRDRTRRCTRLRPVGIAAEESRLAIARFVAMHEAPCAGAVGSNALVGARVARRAAARGLARVAHGVSARDHARIARGASVGSLARHGLRAAAARPPFGASAPSPHPK